MQVTTIRSNAKKVQAWSYSRLKNYETCPKRHWHVDVAKDVREEESEQLLFGNQLHKALALAIAGKEPLPVPFAGYQVWVDKVTSGVGDRTKILTEQQLAIREDFSPTEWFGRDAWYRGIADVIKISGPVALVLDWKTGKIVEDGVQLALMAQCVFAHHPEVQKLRTEFIWLKDDATTRADFSRDDMVSVWASVLPRVHALLRAYEQKEFPPKPGYLCRRWCPVVSCPHHGT